MLVLSRRPDEKILLPSVPAVIKVISSGPGVVRLGIEAPTNVPIVRAELCSGELPTKDPDASTGKASTEPGPNLRHLVRNRVHNLGMALALLRIQLEDCPNVVRSTLDGMEKEIEALRRVLCPKPGTSDPAGEPPLSVQPIA